MSRTWVTGGIVCSLVLLISIGAASAAAKPQTINLLEVSKSFTPTGGLDFQSPPKVGQGFVIESDFYKWQGRKRGAHYGTLQGTCTFTKIVGDASSQFCNVGVFLPGGQITVAGIINQSGLFTIPIVGGTGIYAGARGYVRVRNINENNSADTFVITG